MLIRNFLCVVFFFFVWKDVALASDTAEFNWEGHIHLENSKSEWTQISSHDRINGAVPVCKDNVTTIYTHHKYDPITIYFQPKDQNGILGVSLCRDKTREDCFVIEVFGLVSGRLGYFWRKHSRNETGEELWVPGKESKLPSTLIRSDVAAQKGTWDPDERTLYKFYVDVRNDDYVEIRYDGGIAEQQREMTFEVPKRAYSFSTVASYYKDSQIEVEGAKGCPNYKRIIFGPNQFMEIGWYKPLRAIGISVCSNSTQNECYVFEETAESSTVENKTTFTYFWRKHSLLEENSDEGWVPGLETKLKGTVLMQGNTTFLSDMNDPRRQLEIMYALTRSHEREIVRLSAYTKEYDENGSGSTWRFRKRYLDLPNNSQYTTIRNRAIVDGKEVIRADVSTLGPCFSGQGLLNPLCKQQLSEDIVISRQAGGYRRAHPNATSDSQQGHWSFDVYGVSPKLGKAEANLMSEVLQPNATRKNLCVSVTAIIGAKGGKITVTAMDASKTSNETVQVEQLTYNNIFPLNWQRVRMSADLPPPLQNVPLKVNLKAERPTAESFVLLNEIKLCPYDGVL